MSAYDDPRTAATFPNELNELLSVPGDFNLYWSHSQSPYLTEKRLGITFPAAITAARGLHWSCNWRIYRNSDNRVIAQYEQSTLNAYFWAETRRAALQAEAEANEIKRREPPQGQL